MARPRSKPEDEQEPRDHEDEGYRDAGQVYVDEQNQQAEEPSGGDE